MELFSNQLNSLYIKQAKMVLLFSFNLSFAMSHLSITILLISCTYGLGKLLSGLCPSVPASHELKSSVSFAILRVHHTLYPNKTHLFRDVGTTNLGLFQLTQFEDGEKYEFSFPVLHLKGEIVSDKVQMLYTILPSHFYNDPKECDRTVSEEFRIWWKDDLTILYSCVNSPTTREHDEGLLVFTHLLKQDQNSIKKKLNKTVRVFIGDALMNTIDWSKDVTNASKASPEGNLCKRETSIVKNVDKLPIINATHESFVIIWFFIILCVIGTILCGNFESFKCKTASNRVGVLG